MNLINFPKESKFFTPFLLKIRLIGIIHLDNFKQLRLTQTLKDKIALFAHQCYINFTMSGFFVIFHIDNLLPAPKD